VQASQRTVHGGPALIRLLARLTDVDVPDPGQSLSDRLSQWLGWTDAIALSTALNGGLPAGAPGAHTDGSAEEHECARLRASLAKSIAGDSAFATSRRREGAPTDYAVFRQRYLSLQQTMETGIGSLRGRLRAKLAAGTPGMTRLAMVDAVMEQALAAREHNVLATVPSLLGKHFERLRQAALADASAIDDKAPVAWLDVFRKDMQSVLLAELDVRIQPVEGLLAALRTR
jgi:hypothetical protein